MNTEEDFQDDQNNSVLQHLNAWKNAVKVNEPIVDEDIVYELEDGRSIVVKGSELDRAYWEAMAGGFSDQINPDGKVTVTLKYDFKPNGEKNES